MSDAIRDLALSSNAWPFQEARALLKRYEKAPPEKGYALFETGYGPSGLPHIGTFGEVARTSWVRFAFEQMSDIPTRLIAFSDDMDGLRKVPDNIPNGQVLADNLGKPLTEIPDPFGTHESFGHHNNARLREFLDSFGFEYEFKSSTESYRSGEFDATLLRLLQEYDKVMGVMLPTLGPDRKKTYSPFLPICPRTGVVLQVPVIDRDVSAGTISYNAPETGDLVTVPVTGGHCKLQWKPDWAMRWAALGVDYEMSGKDLIDSAKHSGAICRILGGRPPEGFNYELFLDENAEKISKTRGNGLAVEEWLRYANPESLSLYMFNAPKKAKRLFFDVIPKSVDEYLTHLEKYPDQEPKLQLSNPVWHIHRGKPPVERHHLSFNILLNLASVCNTEDKKVLWGFISRYAPDATPETAPTLDSLVGFAITYYQDFVRPSKQYRAATSAEIEALTDLAAALRKLPTDANAEAIQSEVYEIGKRDTFDDLRAWFKCLYEILLGQEQGPRMGSFIALYGLSETLALIDRAIAGDDLNV